MQETASRRTPLRLLSFLAATLLALAVWNLVLGVAVGKTPGFRQHPELGRVLDEGTLVQSEEGFSRTHIGPLGFRNGEIGPKTPGRSRVLCLGDSFTAGFQVGDGQTFVDRLRGSLGNGVEVVNAGRDGVGPAAALGAARFYRSLDPDLVVIEISPNNLKGQMTDPAANFYVVPDAATDFRIVFNRGYAGDSPLLQRFSKLGRLSALASFPAVKVGVHNLSSMLRSTKELDRQQANAKAPETLCRWTVRALHERFSKLILVYVGQPAYFDPTPPDAQAAFLGDEARKIGVPFLEVAPTLERHYRETGELANGFSNSDPGTGHINGLGHRLLAEALAPMVQRAL